jgi:hypothetical protein
VQKILLLSIYIVFFFPFNEGFGDLFILSYFKDALKASLIVFLVILHSLSYQGLVSLVLFLRSTSIEKLLIEVERVVVKF